MSKLDYLDKIIKKHIPSAYHNDSDEPCDFLPVKEIEKIAREARDLGRLEEREAMNKVVEGMKQKYGKLEGFHGAGYLDAIKDLLNELNKK